ncbi:unnamed protein product [Pieris macdunnoughi]|uniref:Tetratricopeptide repeat protein n=1 Tax=Pieris macdunnoughi TaxID=345717 RepID=A0A821UP15_9NEOP|nr:unnamed protein product [Pieris macdunnoughi]
MQRKLLPRKRVFLRDEKIKAYDSAYNRSSDNFSTGISYGNLGSVLSTQGRVVEAEAAFVRALKYRPNMADVHYNL